MKFTKLHLAGFKTFVEPMEFLIESGLTGVVGPNGCGKSNLVDALRWVMGETSSKTMRGIEMDDVIFSGSDTRPSRNMAEVRLVLDNTDRSAPAAFNDADVIEVGRRIEREEGSNFFINGREVRARDVQLLFADASTSARSPAIVRQGQIGEIVAVKPQQRRRILEEAAGIAGLYSRRHEAELRLKGAEDNLDRLEDVVKQIEQQIDALKRQARQATRYRGIAAEIRRNEALLALVNLHDATAHRDAAERKLEADLKKVAEDTLRQAEAARQQAAVAGELPALRAAEAAAGSELQKLLLARETLDGEERRTKARMAELERRIAEMNADLSREQALIEDAAEVLQRLGQELGELAEMGDETHAEAGERQRLAEAALAQSETELAAAQTAFSDAAARRESFGKTLREESQRVLQFDTEIVAVREDIARLRAERAEADAEAGLETALEAVIAKAKAAEEKAIAAESVHAEARQAEAAARARYQEAERIARGLETETQTLAKLLKSETGGIWPTMIEEVGAAKGYEAALGAALGDDLDASSDVAAPAHWTPTSASDDPVLPEGAAPLAAHVQAPPVLARRLAQIGVVAKSEGKRLQALLRPGQRLVSLNGDLWRWDGLTVAAEVSTAAARRFAEKNRLDDLIREAEVARDAADSLQAAAGEAEADLHRKADAEGQARQNHRAALHELEATRETAAAAERHKAQIAALLSGREEAEQRLRTSSEEALRQQRNAEQALAGLVAAAELAAKLEA
ncbi:MAG: AAA family ATPase, partial [Methylovirgula sp.]